MKHFFSLSMILLILISGCTQTQPAKEWECSDGTIVTEPNLCDSNQSESNILNDSTSEQESPENFVPEIIEEPEEEITPFEPLEPEKEESEILDQCSSKSECDDNDFCTIDACTGQPLQCRSIQVTTCTSNDNCCPLNCNAENDSDCGDGKELELNPCEGISCEYNKKCIQGNCVLKSCSELNGTICNPSSEVCQYGASYETSDAEICCLLGMCQAVGSCGGIECAENEKCVENNCRLKDCSEMGGQICTENSTCSEGEIRAFDDYCCLGICESSQFDVSLSGPVTITNTFGSTPTCYSIIAVNFTVTSTYPETVSLGSYKIFEGGELTHQVTPLNVEPGTNTYSAKLKFATEQESIETIKIEFSCGDKITDVPESSCANNLIEATVNFEQMACD